MKYNNMKSLSILSGQQGDKGLLLGVPTPGCATVAEGLLTQSERPQSRFVGLCIGQRTNVHRHGEFSNFCPIK